MRFSGRRAGKINLSYLCNSSISFGRNISNHTDSDISGYTEFITNTELEHGAHAINILIDAIVRKSVMNMKYRRSKVMLFC